MASYYSQPMLTQGQKLALIAILAWQVHFKRDFLLPVACCLLTLLLGVFINDGKMTTVNSNSETD